MLMTVVILLFFIYIDCILVDRDLVLQDLYVDLMRQAVFIYKLHHVLVVPRIIDLDKIR